jgi:oligogalacturonide lyase
MARGDIFPTERIERTDKVTGVAVMQITSGQTMSRPMHYETTTFTADSERMIILRSRSSRRGSPTDLFACRVDGSEMMQVSGNGDGGIGGACLTVEGDHAMYIEDGALHRTRLDDGSDEIVGVIDSTDVGGGDGMRSYDGRYYFGYVGTGEGQSEMMRWDLRSGEGTVVARSQSFNHLTANPGGPEITYSLAYDLPEPGKFARVTKTCHCETLEELEDDYPFVHFPHGKYGTAHSFWHGKTGMYQGTLQWPGHGIVVMERGVDEPQLVASGPYFWHTGSSYDGEWIVADSNFPDEGLWLVNVHTRRKRLLYYPESSQGDAGYGHLHANLSDDGRLICFQSDATGVPQAYVLQVPDDIRSEFVHQQGDNDASR